MIKLILADEEPPEPERTVRFELRRHKQADSSIDKALLAYLVAREPAHKPFDTDLYPIRIDGRTKTVEVRTGEFEKLGFSVIVK